MSQQPNERMFREKLSILNENFMRYIQTSMRDFPDADYTPTALNYVSHVQELDDMYTVGGPLVGASQQSTQATPLAFNADQMETSTLGPPKNVLPQNFLSSSSSAESFSNFLAKYSQQQKTLGVSSSTSTDVVTKERNSADKNPQLSGLIPNFLNPPSSQKNNDISATFTIPLPKSQATTTSASSGTTTIPSLSSNRKRKPDSALDYDKMKAGELDNDVSKRPTPAVEASSTFVFGGKETTPPSTTSAIPLFQSPSFTKADTTITSSSSGTGTANGNIFPSTNTLKFNWGSSNSKLTFGVPATSSSTTTVDSGTASNANKPSIFASIFAPQAPTNAAVKTNGGDKVDGAEKGSDDEGEPQEEPPKPEEVEQTEKDATFSAKCVVHTFSNGKFEKKGVAYISLKNVDDGRKQIIIRAATTIGAIWTNTFTDHLKWNKADKTRLQITYPLADSKSGPISETVLLRVSKPEELDALIKEFEAQKSS